jgi:alkanesulfonate monooxygenase SsuD/methylene tetrahydromethanopterin reductase-like flavin-dependent oxidoreductase (luciferase family)
VTIDTPIRLSSVNMATSAKFALFDHIEGIPGTSMQTLLRDRLEFIQIADKSGFAGYHLAEHHGSDLCLAPNQEIFLSAAAQLTTQIRLGPLVKILPLHHPLRVIEDICLLDQLSGGRVDYGVGRGPVAIEHFWFNGEWDASYERFDEALSIIAEGLHTGTAGGKDGRKFYDFPPCQVTVSSLQQPNPPFWYPGNPVTAGRYGMSLMWPGPISNEAYDAYLEAWDRHKDDGTRFDAPGSKPRVGTAMGIVVHEDDATAKEISGRGAMGTARRVMNVHKFDHLALDQEQAEAALNPLALGARALLQAGGGTMLAERTAASGSPEHVIDVLGNYLDRGVSDYILLALPSGDQTFEEAKDALELFASDVMPKL